MIYYSTCSSLQQFEIGIISEQNLKKKCLCTYVKHDEMVCARVLCVTNLPSTLCKAENFPYPIFNNKF